MSLVGVENNRRLVQKSQDDPWLDPVNVGLNYRLLPDYYKYPENVDPLNYVAGEALKEIVRIWYPGKSAICIIPDEVMRYALASCSKGWINVSVFRHFLFHELNFEQVDDGHCVILRPADPMVADLDHADRRVLGQSLRGFIREELVSLRAWSKMLYRLGSGSDSFFAQWYRRSFCFPLIQLDSNVNTTVLRLIGSLPEGDWSQLYEQGSLKLSNENCDQRLVERILRFQSLLPNSSLKLSDKDGYLLSLFPGGVGDNFRGAISGDSAYIAARSNKDRISGCTNYQLIHSQFLASRLSYPFQQKLKNQKGNALAAFNEVVQGVEGSWQTYENVSIRLRLELPKQIYLEQSFTEYVPRQKNPVKFNSLDRDYLNSIYQAVLGIVERQKSLLPKLRRPPF